MTEIDVLIATQALLVEDAPAQTIVLEAGTLTPIVIETAVPTVTVTLAGPQGPQGIQGVRGDLDVFTYEQATPASVWAVTHNLDRYPASVLVLDSGGTAIEGEVVYTDTNHLTIIFDVPGFSGTAYIV